MGYEIFTNEILQESIDFYKESIKHYENGGFDKDLTESVIEDCRYRIMELEEELKLRGQ
jgi:hypothetical protein